MKKKVIFILGMFLVGNILKMGLLTYPYTLVTYSVQAVINLLSGMVLSYDIITCKRGDSLFWSMFGLAMFLIIIFPLFGCSYKLTVFVATSNPEIVPAFLLGICLSALTQGRKCRKKACF